MPPLIQRAADPKLSAGAVTAFVKLHQLLSEAKVTKYGKPSTVMEYFRSIWTAVYQLWTHLIRALRLGKDEKFFLFLVKVNRYFA